MTRSTLSALALLIATSCLAAPEEKVFACDGLDGEVFYTTEERARCVEATPPSAGTVLYRCVGIDGKVVYSGRIVSNTNCSILALPAPESRSPETPPPASPPPRPAWVTPQRTFGGYPCTQDCSGHEAGYAWAEDNGIEDASDCDGRSNSFIEGCESYVEENYPDSDEDGISDDDEDYDCIDDDGC